MVRCHLTDEIDKMIEQQKYYHKQHRAAKRAHNEYMAQFYLDRCEEIVKAKDILIRMRSDMRRQQSEENADIIPD